MLSSVNVVDNSIIMNQFNNGFFIISLDFEKYWGVRDHKSIQDYSENLGASYYVAFSLNYQFGKSLFGQFVNPN